MNEQTAAVVNNVDDEDQEQRSLNINDLFKGFAAGSQSRSGAIVNADTALTTSPVWQAIDLITSDISRIPFLTYRELPTGGRVRETGNVAYRLLRRHTGEMTSNLWLIRMVGQALIYGNAYTEILYDRRNQPRGFRWLHSEDVEPEIEDGVRFYLVKYDQDKHGKSGVQRVAETDMIHLVGLTLDAFHGKSLMRYARHTFGRLMSGENYSDDFFINDATPSGWFEHPAEMSLQAQERFLEAVARRHSGPGNRFKLGILEENMKYNPVGVTPKDAMVIEQMQWSVKDVARYFNLPPHKLGDDTKVAYNSIEQENRSYFDSSLGKWVSRLEAEVTYKLFGDVGDLFCEFLQDAWFKAETKSRYESYAIALQNGLMSRNEIRTRENLTPYEGGDDFLIPLNLGVTTEIDEVEDTEEVDESNTPDDTRAKLAIRDFLAERLRESTRLLANAAERAAKKPTKFMATINNFDQRFRAQIQDKLDAPLRVAVTYSGGDPDDVIADVVQSVFVEASRSVMQASDCQAEQMVERVGAIKVPLATWSDNYATQTLFGTQENETPTT